MAWLILVNHRYKYFIVSCFQSFNIFSKCLPYCEDLVRTHCEDTDVAVAVVVHFYQLHSGNTLCGYYKNAVRKLFQTMENVHFLHVFVIKSFSFHQSTHPSLTYFHFPICCYIRIISHSWQSL